MAKSIHWELQGGKKRAGLLAFELARYNAADTPDTLAEKYARMSVTPFSFYRGTAHLYYHDMNVIDYPWCSRFHDDRCTTWIQGDLHLSNFGAFCDAEGDIVFDLNDFDEAWTSNYLYDVLRGAVSLVLTGVDNGFSGKDLKRCIQTYLNRYLEMLDVYAEGDREQFFKVTEKQASGPLKRFLRKAAEKNSRQRMLDKWTLEENGSRRFNLDLPRLSKVNADDDLILRSAVAAYKEHLDSNLRGDEAYFRVLDTAMRLGAGIGSLGTPRYYILVRGRADDPHGHRLLDLKQQTLPAVFPFLSKQDQSSLLQTYGLERAGKRVIQAQKAMLKDPDKHLGWFSILGRSFSVRERSPYKKSLKVEKLIKLDHFHAMADHWGLILATCHARGDDAIEHGGTDGFERGVLDLTRNKNDAFISEIYTLANEYSSQVHEDHRLFLQMIGKA